MGEPFVIALCGHMRAGKDTLAEHLVREHNFENVKFSSHLKEIVKLAFDLDDEDVESSMKDVVHERLHVKPRKLMDFIGTQVFQYDIQKILPNVEPRCFWANSLLNRIKDKANVVISDLRFLHEHKRLTEMYPNHLIVKIERPNNDDSTSLYVSEQEVEEIPYDIKIINSSSIVELIQTFETHIRVHLK